MVRLLSKFESSLVEIEANFKGPYPLDRHVLGGLVSKRPGIYIWYESLNGRRLGYVGQASRLLNRLAQWASDVEGGEVYFEYVNKSQLNEVEKQWILKAGDLNKK